MLFSPQKALNRFYKSENKHLSELEHNKNTPEKTHELKFDLCCMGIRL